MGGNTPIVTSYWWLEFQLYPTVSFEADGGKRCVSSTWSGDRGLKFRVKRIHTYFMRRQNAFRPKCHILVPFFSDTGARKFCWCIELTVPYLFVGFYFSITLTPLLTEVTILFDSHQEINVYFRQFVFLDVKINIHIAVRSMTYYFKH